MCALISYLDILAASNLLSQVGPPWALIIGRRKGVAWRRKGRTAEVWVGNERAEIFEYFGKLEKSMVWCGLKPLHKAHESGMSKVRKDRIPGKFWPGPGWAVCGVWPARLGGRLFLLGWRQVGLCLSVLWGSCPEHHTQILCVCDCLHSTTGKANLVVF